MNTYEVVMFAPFGVTELEVEAEQFRVDDENNLIFLSTFGLVVCMVHTTLWARVTLQQEEKTGGKNEERSSKRDH